MIGDLPVIGDDDEHGVGLVAHALILQSAQDLLVHRVDRVCPLVEERQQGRLLEADSYRFVPPLLEQAGEGNATDIPPATDGEQLQGRPAASPGRWARSGPTRISNRVRPKSARIPLHLPGISTMATSGPSSGCHPTMT